MRTIISFGTNPLAFQNIILELLPKFKEIGFAIETKESNASWGHRGTGTVRTAKAITKVILTKEKNIIELHCVFAFNTPSMIDNVKSVDLMLMIGYCIAFTEGVNIGDFCFPDKFTDFNYRSREFGRPFRIKNDLINIKFLNKFRQRKYLHMHCLTNPLELYKALPEMDGKEKEYFTELYKRYDIGEMESAMVADNAKSHKKRFGELLICSDDKKTSIGVILEEIKKLMKQAISNATGKDIKLNSSSEYTNYISKHNEKEKIWGEYNRLILTSASMPTKEFDKISESLKDLILKLITTLIAGEL